MHAHLQKGRLVYPEECAQIFLVLRDTGNVTQRPGEAIRGIIPKRSSRLEGLPIAPLQKSSPKLGDWDRCNKELNKNKTLFAKESNKLDE